MISDYALFNPAWSKPNYLSFLPAFAEAATRRQVSNSFAFSEKLPAYADASAGRSETALARLRKTK